MKDWYLVYKLVTSLPWKWWHCRVHCTPQPHFLSQRICWIGQFSLLKKVWIRRDLLPPKRQSTKSIFIASLYSVALSFPDDNNFSCPGRLFLSKGKFSLHVCPSPKKLGIFKLLSNEKYWISWKVFSRMVGDIILNPITWCQFAF